MSLLMMSSILINTDIVNADVILQPTSEKTVITSDRTDTSAVHFTLQGKNQTTNNEAIAYPITSVSADYTRNNHITKKTQNVWITLNGYISSPYENGWVLPPQSTLQILWNLLVDDSGNELTSDDGRNISFSPTHDLSVNTTVHLTLPSTKTPTPGNKIWLGNQTKISYKGGLLGGLFTQYGTGTYYLTSRQWYQTVSQINLSPTVVTPKLNDTTLTGTGSQVGDIISANINGVTKTATVTSSGMWTINWGSVLPYGSSVSVTESNDYGDNPGTVTTSVPVLPAELKFVNTISDITFNTMSMSAESQGYIISNRQNPNWGLDVYDSRNAGVGGKWYVSAYMNNSNLVSSNNHILTTPVYYKTLSGQLTPLSSSPLLIFTNDAASSIYKESTLTNSGNYTTHAAFQNGNGFILRSIVSQVYANENYTGTISLTLNDVPS